MNREPMVSWQQTSLCLCLSLSLCFCLPVSLCLYLCLSIALYLSVCLSVSLALSLSRSLAFSFSLFVSLSLSLSLFYLIPSLPLSSSSSPLPCSFQCPFPSLCPSLPPFLSQPFLPSVNKSDVTLSSKLLTVAASSQRIRFPRIRETNKVNKNCHIWSWSVS